LDGEADGAGAVPLAVVAEFAEERDAVAVGVELAVPEVDVLEAPPAVVEAGLALLSEVADVSAAAEVDAGATAAVAAQAHTSAPAV
jgi:hypothetical protein